MIRRARCVVVLLIVPKMALACSCPPSTTVESAYESADAIFVGRLVSTTRPSAVVELSRFRVLRVFKGARIGQVVEFRSDLNVCDASARNDPPFMVEKQPTKGPYASRKSKAPRHEVSKDWLLYYNKPPRNHLVVNCGRSLPINLLDVDLPTDQRGHELEELAHLSEAQRKQNPHR